MVKQRGLRRRLMPLVTAVAPPTPPPQPVENVDNNDDASVASEGSSSSRSSDSPVAAAPLRFSKLSRKPKRALQQRRPYLYKEHGGSCTSTSSSNGLSWVHETTQTHNNDPLDKDLDATSPDDSQWLNWFESGICYLGCQGGSAAGGGQESFLEGQQQNDQAGLRSPGFGGSKRGAAPPPRNPEEYVRLHEEFFESLLKEQIRGHASLGMNGERPFSAAAATTTLMQTIGETQGSGPLRQTESRDSHTSISSGVSTVSSNTMESGGASNASMKTLRKHRPLQLHILSFRGKNLPKKRSSDGARLLRSSSSSAIDADSSNVRRHSYHHHARVAPMEAFEQINNPSPSADPSAISLAEIATKSHLPEPEHFLHAHCFLQKDKGRGDEPLGCSISAKGRDACLDKLREKMKLVMLVSGEDSNFRPSKSCSSNGSSLNGGSMATAGVSGSGKLPSPTTGMKRRPAKISRIGNGYVETRSMLELQLGFLSMQYGLLLQWDTQEMGKIVFICLRKMCHDSFYTKIPELVLQEGHPPCAASSLALRKHPGQVKRSSPSREHRSIQQRRNRESNVPPLVVRSRRGNHAIYYRSSEEGATEVVLVNHPYRSSRPAAFDPSILTIDIHECTGLSKKSDWALSLTFDGHTEITHLKYNPSRDLFETTRNTPCKWEMAMPHLITSFDAAGLELRLFERRGVGLNGGSIKQAHRRLPLSRRQSSSSINSRNSFSSFNSSGSSNSHTQSRPLHKNSRLASTMSMPLGELVTQPSTSETTLWKLTMPFTHDEKAQLTLTLIHQSKYAHWLYRELKARRKEEIATNESSLWGSSLLGRYASSSPNEDEDPSVELDEDNSYQFYFPDCLCGCCE